MADLTEDNDTASNWAKNAEEHDRLRQELTSLIVQVEAIAKATKELDEAQKESRSELLARINRIEDRIDRMESRIDLVYAKVESTATELKKDLGGLIDKAETRIKEVREDLSGKIVDANKRMDEPKDDIKYLISLMRWVIVVGIALVTVGLTVIGLFAVGG